MNICVVGTGYVGLVTGAVFADLGNDVLCVDNQPEKVAALQAGKMPIYEPEIHHTRMKRSADWKVDATTGTGESGRERPVVAAVGPGDPVLELLPRVTHGVAQRVEAAGDRDGIAALVAGFPHPFPATAADRHELHLHSVHVPAPSARLAGRLGLQETECNRSATESGEHGPAPWDW